MGEVVRIAAGKAILELLQKELKTVLFEEGVQFGVAVPCGTKDIVHSVHISSFYHNDPTVFKEKVVLKVDSANSFNSVNRNAIFAAVKEFCPTMRNMVKFLFSQASYLYWFDEKILSVSGVQQGDPLGPAHFSFALHAVFKRIKEDPDCS